MRTRHFRYKSYGEGSTIVLIPGLDGITEFFADAIPELARRFRVLVYHLPLKREADAAGAPYDFAYIAQDLKSVLDEVHADRVHVVGESFGGVVAQTFALTYPHAVETLTLISSAPHFELSRKNRLLLPLFRFTPMWLFARVHLGDVCEPHDPEWAKELFLRGAGSADHASVFARAQIVSRVDLRARIADIHCPVLMVVGAADRFTGRASREMLQQLPHARLVEIANGGHLCHMTHPQEFLDALVPFVLASA
jgi:pimeloyl-ACP methyl ester carboxylesterase